MGRRVRRVPVHLDSQGVRALSFEDIRAILRGADDLIMRGGRTLLTQLLRGSRAKKLLELGLDSNPSYGRFRDLPVDEVQARVDWMIQKGYLAIEYDWRLPLLVFTDRGWAIERETVVEELLRNFDRMLATSQGPYDLTYLKDRDRGMILLLLDKVEATGDSKYIPLLEAWAAIEHQKVRQRIRQVAQQLSQPRDGAARDGSIATE